MIMEWRSWDSRGELEEFLSRHSHRMLRRSSEPESAFYSVSIQPELDELNVAPATFGICGEGHGTAPQVVRLPMRTSVLLAIDDTVIGVDTRNGNEYFRLSTASLIHSMTILDDQASVLVFHELGATLLDVFGSTVWNFSRDVVTSSRIDGDVVHLSFMDTPAVTLSLSSGQVIED